jgi:mono/diheme cytochrome c family protein
LACHQPHGLGQEGLAPPLVGAEWVTGSPERLARIVIHGLRGPVTVNKQVFELDMPSLGVLDDEQIAAVLTYVRREWGHAASAVDTAAIKKIREATANREDAWTEAELLKIP